MVVSSARINRSSANSFITMLFFFVCWNSPDDICLPSNSSKAFNVMSENIHISLQNVDPAINLLWSGSFMHGSRSSGED